MNNPNPFLPQGVFLEEKNKARNRLRIAVYSSISLSVLVLMVLLFQGCKKPAETTDNGDSTANTQQLANSQSDMTASNATTLTPPPTESNTAPLAPAPAPVVNTPPPVAAPPPPVADVQEYTIVKNDTYATIHNNFKVSVKALIDANPGVDPKKLKVGQKIKIPAATTPSSTSVTPMNAPMATDTSAAGGVTYKVKSGDNLTTISRHYHVSIKAIQSANNLSTTSIKVGQVLKIPGAAAPAPAPEASPVPPPMTAPPPATSMAPMH